MTPIRYRVASPWLATHRLLKNFYRPPLPGAFRILILHGVPDPHLPLLERLIRYLLKHHGIISPTEAKVRLHAERTEFDQTAEAPFLLTFDDGLHSNVKASVDVLDQFGVKAIFFVCPGLIEASIDCQEELVLKHIYDGYDQRDLSSCETRLMSWGDAENLMQAGHTIGSHSMHHRRWSELSEVECRDEVHCAASLLERRLGVRKDWIAYPFGNVQSINQSALRVVAEAYRFLCSGVRGINSSMTHPLSLRRDHIALTAPEDYQRLILSGGLDVFYRKHRRHLSQLTRSIASPQG